MRRIRNPEVYCSPKAAAAMMREMADQIERGPAETWVSLYVSMSFAERQEVEAALAKRAAKSTRGGAA